MLHDARRAEMARAALNDKVNPRSLEVLRAKMLYLSARELEVTTYYGRGYHVRDIASTLKLSVKTVSTFLARAKDWLGIRDRQDFVALVHGYEPDSPVTIPGRP